MGDINPDSIYVSYLNSSSIKNGIYKGDEINRILYACNDEGEFNPNAVFNTSLFDKNVKGVVGKLSYGKISLSFQEYVQSRKLKSLEEA
ncbi:MAG TPA: hypothetical protein VJH65_01000 [Candidatus Nanoarchaeia archaeon]|nr:hypothetical protein [Candidatus Nanoarchaeia archaeon]